MRKHKYIFSTKQTTHYRFPTHVNDLVIDRADAVTSEVFIVVLEAGESPPMHLHADTEQIFYILEGSGMLHIGGEPQPYPVNPGDVVRIPPHTPHRIECRGSRALRYLCVDCFVGGRPENEPTWESHVRVMCAEHGWDFGKIRSCV